MRPLLCMALAYGIPIGIAHRGGISRLGLVLKVYAFEKFGKSCPSPSLRDVGFSLQFKTNTTPVERSTVAWDWYPKPYKP